MFTHVYRFSLAINFIALMVCIARMVERRWPIAVTPVSEVVDDWKAAGISFTLPAIFAPLTTASSSLILSTLGHGWIPLPTNGYWWFVTLAVLAVVSDLYTYMFHRLQHAIPFLWAMHSFHHSANALTFATGARHYWMEKVMTSAVLPILPILFLVPRDMQCSFSS